MRQREDSLENNLKKAEAELIALEKDVKMSGELPEKPTEFFPARDKVRSQTLEVKEDANDTQITEECQKYQVLCMKRAKNGSPCTHKTNNDIIDDIDVINFLNFDHSEDEEDTNESNNDNENENELESEVESETKSKNSKEKVRDRAAYLAKRRERNNRKYAEKKRKQKEKEMSETKKASTDVDEKVVNCGKLEINK